MAVDDIVGIQIHGRYQMQNIVNVMHYKITEQVADDHSVLSEFCSGWATALTTAWLARHIDTYSLMGLKAFSLTGANKKPGIIHIDDAGSIVGEECPSPICRVITLYTDSDNYRRRGRLMLSGSADSHFNDADGAVADAELTLLEGLGDDMIADVSNNGNVCEPGLKPTDVLPFAKFTDVLARRTPACIRSRRVRGFAVG